MVAEVKATRTARDVLLAELPPLLIEQIARHRQTSRKNVEAAVVTIFRAMSDALIDGDRIEIRGFGSFEVRAYGATSRGTMRKRPFFKPGKALRQRIDSAGGGDAGSF